MNKNHILDEIRRTAKANGGVPIGRVRFFAETGIKESDWSGIHWARWGDAIREAGLTANEKVKAYDEDWLILQFITLARELGRIPTAPEMRLHGRKQKDFPNEKTFASRFGGRTERSSKIAEYCRSHEGFEDVLRMFDSEPNSATPQAEDDNEPADEIGSVYLLKSGRFYKIGRSNAAGRRERELAIQLPERANIIHQIRTDDPEGIEFYWHRRFAEFRKNGEWFDLSASDVKRFKRRKFM